MEGESGVEGGRKRATINDIARLAGVSKKTVSRVINQSPFVRDETRERIEAVIAEMLQARTSERQGRVIDHDPGASMEKKKQEGYF